MRKAWNTVKAFWFWYVVRYWWYIKPPKPVSGVRKRGPGDYGQTLDDE